MVIREEWDFNLELDGIPFDVPAGALVVEAGNNHDVYLIINGARWLRLREPEMFKDSASKTFRLVGTASTARFYKLKVKSIRQLLASR